jgi:hypothetical protein
MQVSRSGARRTVPRPRGEKWRQAATKLPAKSPNAQHGLSWGPLAPRSKSEGRAAGAQGAKGALRRGCGGELGFFMRRRMGFRLPGASGADEARWGLVRTGSNGECGAPHTAVPGCEFRSRSLPEGQVICAKLVTLSVGALIRLSASQHQKKQFVCAAVGPEQASAAERRLCISDYFAIFSQTGSALTARPARGSEEGGSRIGRQHRARPRVDVSRRALELDSKKRLRSVVLGCSNAGVPSAPPHGDLAATRRHRASPFQAGTAGYTAPAREDNIQCLSTATNFALGRARCRYLGGMILFTLAA